MSTSQYHSAQSGVAHGSCRPVKKRRGAPLVQHVPINSSNPAIPDQSNGQPQPEPQGTPRDGAAPSSTTTSLGDALTTADPVPTAA